MRERTSQKSKAVSIIMERYKFNKRDRQPGESISFYVTERKLLLEHCDFGVTFEDMIRDMLVCGVRSPKIQQHLLAKTELNFDRALKIASAMERVKKMSAVLKGCLG